MNALIETLPLLVFVVLGVCYAGWGVVHPPKSLHKIPRFLRVAILILGAWIGTFLVSAISNKIGYALNDGIAYDEGIEVPYDVMHDGVGSNVVNLFLGWISGYIFWGIAILIWKTRPESDA